MTRSTPWTALLLATALLAGCGKKEVLKPAAGHKLPQKAKTASVAPNVTQMLTPTAEQRPARDNELVNKSKPLDPDRFDLPPPG